MLYSGDKIYNQPLLFFLKGGSFVKRIFPRLFFILIILIIYSNYAAAAEPKLIEKNFSLSKVQAEWELYVPP